MNVTTAASPGGTGLRLSTPRGRWVLAATVLGSGMAALDATVVGIALPAIGRDFHVGVASLQWVVDAYTLTLAGLLLLGGTLGDRYGRRRMFVVGTVWFAVASLLCGVAPNVGVLIAARALQGVGAALLTPGSLAILQASFAEDDRSARDRRLVGARRRGHRDRPVRRRLADQRGLLAAGVLHQPAAGRGRGGDLRPARARDEGARTGAELDITGAVCITGALVGITYGLIAASPASGWTLGRCVVPLVVGVVLLAVRPGRGAARRRADAAARDVPSRQFSAANAVTFVVYAALGGVLFLLPIVLQEVAGYSPLAAGAALLPVTVIMLAAVRPVRRAGGQDRPAAADVGRPAGHRRGAAAVHPDRAAPATT